MDVKMIRNFMAASDYQLTLLYDEPYAVTTGSNQGFCVDYSATMHFNVVYDANARGSLARKMNEIMKGNPGCLLDHGATLIIGEHNNE